VKVARFVCNFSLNRNVGHGFRKVGIFERSVVGANVEAKKRHFFFGVNAFGKTADLKITRSRYVVQRSGIVGRNKREKILKPGHWRFKRKVVLLAFIEQLDKAVKFERKLVNYRFILLKRVFALV